MQHFVHSLLLLCYINFSVETDHENISLFYSILLISSKSKRRVRLMELSKVNQTCSHSIKYWRNSDGDQLATIDETWTFIMRRENAECHYHHPNVMDLCQKPSTDLISVIGDKLISVIRFLLPGDRHCFYTFPLQTYLKCASQDHSGSSAC